MLKERFHHPHYLDAAAAVYDLLDVGKAGDRWRESGEWDRWMLLGADCVLSHPDHPQPLTAEMETYRGCVRYVNGGCSFCVEPLKGRPVFREPEAIVAEARALRERGVVNFRLGSQTCIISYKAELDGTDCPRPNPDALEELLYLLTDSQASAVVVALAIVFAVSCAFAGGATAPPSAATLLDPSGSSLVGVWKMSYDPQLQGVQELDSRCLIILPGLSYIRIVDVGVRRLRLLRRMERCLEFGLGQAIRQRIG